MKTLTEYLVEYLSHTKLFEMAIERKKYIQLVKSLEQQIFENWCLIRYAKIYGNAHHKQYINHWKQELKTYLLKLSSVDIKGGNKSNAITQLWINEFEYQKHPDAIYGMIIIKFESEQIDTDAHIDIMLKIATACTNDITYIINIISSGDAYKISQYVREL